jgi:hypothetical protein
MDHLQVGYRNNPYMILVVQCIQRLSLDLNNVPRF